MARILISRDQTCCALEFFYAIFVAGRGARPHGCMLSSGETPEHVLKRFRHAVLRNHADACSRTHLARTSRRENPSCSKTPESFLSTLADAAQMVPPEAMRAEAARMTRSRASPFDGPHPVVRADSLASLVLSSPPPSAMRSRFLRSLTVRKRFVFSACAGVKHVVRKARSVPRREPSPMVYNFTTAGTSAWCARHEDMRIAALILHRLGPGSDTPRFISQSAADAGAIAVQGMRAAETELVVIEAGVLAAHAFIAAYQGSIDFATEVATAAATAACTASLDGLVPAEVASAGAAAAVKAREALRRGHSYPSQLADAASPPLPPCGAAEAEAEAEAQRMIEAVAAEPAGGCEGEVAAHEAGVQQSGASISLPEVRLGAEAGLAALRDEAEATVAIAPALGSV